MTIEETKQQIESCPPEFFWVINIEKIRLTDSENKAGTGIVNYFNREIEKGNLAILYGKTRNSYFEIIKILKNAYHI